MRLGRQVRRGGEFIIRVFRAFRGRPRGAIQERVYSCPLVSIRGWPARGACLTSVEDGGREEQQAFGALTVKFTDFFVGDGIAPWRRGGRDGRRRVG